VCFPSSGVCRAVARGTGPRLAAEMIDLLFSTGERVQFTTKDKRLGVNTRDTGRYAGSMSKAMPKYLSTETTAPSDSTSKIIGISITAIP
jgi:hypothetical protein